MRNPTRKDRYTVGIGAGKGRESKFQEAAEREWKWGRRRVIGDYGGASKGGVGSVRRSSRDQGPPMVPFLKLRIRKGTDEAADCRRGSAGI